MLCDLLFITSVDQWDTPRRPLWLVAVELLYARSFVRLYNNQCAVWAEARSIDSTTSQLGFGVSVGGFTRVEASLQLEETQFGEFQQLRRE